MLGASTWHFQYQALSQFCCSPERGLQDDLVMTSHQLILRDDGFVEHKRKHKHEYELDCEREHKHLYYTCREVGVGLVSRPMARRHQAR
jgi:hypothetical protein